MNLNTFLKSRCLSQKEFADMISLKNGERISAMTISNYITGKRCPRIDIAFAIERKTKVVTVKEMFEFWEAKNG